MVEQLFFIDKRASSQGNPGTVENDFLKAVEFPLNIYPCCSRGFSVGAYSLRRFSLGAVSVIIGFDAG
uniref:YSIRK-type signal peptide-containing protein n=1 Tax=Kamptonema formosum TaxID=331992 RepID=UPI003898EF16